MKVTVRNRAANWRAGPLHIQHDMYPCSCCAGFTGIDMRLSFVNPWMRNAMAAFAHLYNGGSVLVFTSWNLKSLRSTVFSLCEWRLGCRNSPCQSLMGPQDLSAPCPRCQSPVQSPQHSPLTGPMALWQPGGPVAGMPSWSPASP